MNDRDNNLEDFAPMWRVSVQS